MSRGYGLCSGISLCQLFPIDWQQDLFNRLAVQEFWNGGCSHQWIPWNLDHSAVLLPVEDESNMKSSTKAVQILNNDKGSALIVIVCLIISGVLAAALIEMLNSSTKMNSQAYLTEARTMLFQRTQSMLRSPVVMNYTLTNFHSPAKNAKLKSCIQSGTQDDPSCHSVPMEFYFPNDNAGGTKFAGTADSPAYVTQAGAVCDVDTPGCNFKVTMDCYFLCPGNQTSCAMVKVMGCDLKITPSNSLVLRALSLVSKTQTFAAAYSIRLSSDMNSFTAVPTYVPIPCYLQSIIPADCTIPGP